MTKPDVPEPLSRTMIRLKIRPVPGHIPEAISDLLIRECNPELRVTSNISCLFVTAITR